jgi:hypothetical protein
LKLTKHQLKQLIKEELQNILEFGDDIGGGPSASIMPTGDVDTLIADIQKCLADGGLMVGFKCGPIALQLATAIAEENWPTAIHHAMQLQNCVPRSCARAVQNLIKALPKA